MAFKANGTKEPFGGPVLRSQIIANSAAVVEMDSMKAASGFVTINTAGVAVFGHAVAIATSKGVGQNTTGVAGAAIGSFVGAFTVPSDNQTVAKNKAVCDISKQTQYSAELDAAIGTTTGSNLLGYYIDIVDEDTLDEDTAATSAAQYFIWGVDPLDATKAVVSIYESSVYGA